jgi:hypothetical protein
VKTAERSSSVAVSSPRTRFEFTVRDAGDDCLDSDVDPSTGEAIVTLAAGEINETLSPGIHLTG